MDATIQTTATETPSAIGSSRITVQTRRRSAQKRRAAKIFDSSSVPGSELRKGRTLWLVDIENILGAGFATREDIRRTWTEFTRHMGIAADDLVIIGCAHHLGVTAIFEVDPRIQFVFRSGPDGGESALIDHVDPAWAARRFNWVVIASGDHAFTPWVLHARSLGMRAWQVTGRGASSVQLASACDVHTHLRLGTRDRTVDPSPARVTPASPQGWSLPRFCADTTSDGAESSLQSQVAPNRRNAVGQPTRRGGHSRNRSRVHAVDGARHASGRLARAHRAALRLEGLTTTGEPIPSRDRGLSR